MSSRRQVVVAAPDGTPHVFGWRDGSEYAVDVPGIAEFRITEHEEIRVLAKPDADRDAVEREYCGTAVPFAAHITGDEALHASAVLWPTGVVAFSGASMAGKSTLAYALGRRGYPQWADDSTVIRITEHSVSVRSLPFVVSLRPGPFQSGARGAPTSENTVGQAGATAPLVAIMVLDPTGEGRPTSMRSAPGDALHDLLANTYHFPPLGELRRRKTVERLLDLVTRIPVYRFRFAHDGGDIDRTLDSLEALIDELAIASDR